MALLSLGNKCLSSRQQCSRHSGFSSSHSSGRLHIINSNIMLLLPDKQHQYTHHRGGSNIITLQLSLDQLQILHPGIVMISSLLLLLVQHESSSQHTGNSSCSLLSLPSQQQQHPEQSSNAVPLLVGSGRVRVLSVHKFRQCQPHPSPVMSGGYILTLGSPTR